VTKIICGVDVSKTRLDACALPSGATAAFANDPEGRAELAAFCLAQAVERVALEATGAFEQDAAAACRDAGVPVAIVNPRHVRRFAEAMGTLEKTDRIDARLIARFCLARGLGPSPQAGPKQLRLKALAARLRQVTDDLVVQKQRRSSARDQETRNSLDEVIALFKRQARRLEGEIASLIDDDPLWSRLDRAFREIKGVAGRTVARLMADMPEIGTWSNKAIAKLAGLAPIADDSGKRQGARHIRGGRTPVRSILFLVADIARRYDKNLADFHHRLSAAGKPKMVVRIALARKLLVRLNAKARDARIELANAA
jgi:transposase